MELITHDQFERLLANGCAQRHAQDHDMSSIDFTPVVKLFTPDANCTWLLTEIDPDGIAFGLCDLGLGEPELGYVDLMELQAAHGRLGLPIERDLDFQADRPLSSYADEAEIQGRIVA